MQQKVFERRRSPRLSHFRKRQCSAASSTTTLETVRPMKYSPPFSVVPMPVNAKGTGPEMDPSKVVKRTWEVWDALCLDVSSHDKERDAFRTKAQMDRFGMPLSVRQEVVKLMQNVYDHSIATHHGQSSSWSNLSWWKRLINKFPFWDTPPFRDPANWHEIKEKPVSSIVDISLITKAMQMLADKPVCKHCGGNQLASDLSGYYYDALRWDGAPLCCVGQCREDEK